jgi:hypothetical protein
MTGSILLLIVCYALLALLVLALCLYTRWSFAVKTIAILAVTGFYFIAYDGLLGVLGYATAGDLPERFLYHYAVIAQPDKSIGEKGTIFLWATALMKDGTKGEPRAYRLPFDKDTHKMLSESQRRAEKGIAQVGQANEIAPREGSSAFSRFLATQGTKRIKMQDMADPALPEK